MNSTQKAYLQLHIAIFLFGFTAILGRVISIGELPLVWWRLILTCTSLLFLPKVIGALKSMPRKTALQLSGIGCIVALHWVFFFGAVKYSNVSVTLTFMATVTVFTAFLEPVFFKTKIKWYEVLLGVIIIPGMYLVVKATDLSMYTGIWMALLSALLAALFTIFNKKQVANTLPMAITFVELGSGLILLSLLAPLYFYFFNDLTLIPTLEDFGYLLILALLCTTLAYVLSLYALRVLSPFTSNLAINLEPVYGIIMAYFFFQENEELGGGFYVGVAIILLSVSIYPWLKKRFG